MSCGRLLAWPFWCVENSDVGDGSGKMQIPRIPTCLFFCSNFSFILYLTLLVTTCIEFSPVVCRKISEASQVGEWLALKGTARMKPVRLRLSLGELGDWCT